MKRTILFALLGIVTALSMPKWASAATTLTFEGVAPAGGTFPLSNSGYRDSGFFSQGAVKL